MFEDVDLGDILEDKRTISDVAKMLAILDAKHGLALDEKIGLLGYIEDKNYEYKIEDKVGFPLDNRNLEKRGDCFEVISEYGEILLDEKVTHTLVIENNKGYVFILKDKKKEDNISSFFDMEMTEYVIVIYDEKGLRTNDKSLKYKYDEDIKIEPIALDMWRICIDLKAYSSYKINENNKIYGLKLIRGNDDE